MRLLPAKLPRIVARYGARWAIGLALTVLAALQVAAVLPLDAVERLDTVFADMRMRLTPPVHDARIVIVDIDVKSLEEVGRFPWSRNVVARLVRRLTTDYESAAIGFDVTFAEPDTSSGYGVLEALAERQFGAVPGLRERLAALKPELDYDGLLAAALEDQPVVLGYSVTDGNSKGVLPAPFFTTEDLNGRRLDANLYRGYEANIERLQAAAATAGIFSTHPDPDGILRSSPLLVRIGDGYYPTLSLATAAVALGARAVKPVYFGTVDTLSARERENGGLDTIDMFYGERQRKRIPVGQNLTTVIEFRGRGGPAGGAFSYVSAADVLAGRADKALLAGTIVLVGTTAPGLFDLRATPVNAVYPGVEVHANLIKSMLDDSFKHRPDYAFAIELGQVLLLGVLLSFTLAVLTPLRAIVVALAAAGAAFAFNYWMYAQLHWAVDLAALLLLAFAVFLFNLGWGYIFEFRKGRALVSRFGEYVAPELVAEMAEDPEKYNMDGESRELTVLFVDVRGFTTISEGLTPKALREYINLYLTAMSEDIRDSHRGTLDKYIGDAVMAFWGAPVAFPDHASRAVATALLMQASAQRLNDEFVARGWPPLKIGVGLNSGLMHVGDMGSKIRRAYTVMGDAVNLGSRLEGITKVYGVGIAVGQATREAAPEFLYRELDLVRVKGKNEPVAIYQPLCKAGELDAGATAALARWHQALALVRGQRWDEAQAILEQLQAADPGFALYPLYLGRIGFYRAHPPEADWDGVTTFDTK